MSKTSYKTKSNSAIHIPEHCLADLTVLLTKLGAERYLEENILNIPQGIIGHIETDSLKISIEPSIEYFSCQDYLRLVNPTENLSKSNNGFLDMQDSTSLSSYIINEFFNSLRSEIKTGLPRRYLIRESQSHYATGNIDYIESYKRVSLHEDPVFVTSTAELSTNFSILKVIKAAYNKACKFQDNLTDYAIISALANIETPRTCNDLLDQPTHFSRNESGLSYTYDLAKMIIRNMDSISKKSDYEMSLLINANVIFEDFLLSLLTSLFPRDKFEGQAECIITDGDKELSSFADIIFHGIHTVVIDAKNKRYLPSPSNSDYYQMFSYLDSYKVKTAVLVYPHYENDEPKVVTPKGRPELQIYMVPLNIKPTDHGLSRDHFEHFKLQMEQLLRFG
jgi:5-methylcytosine-specific restriction endonuclease McrBC regulatory subunit McrC